ncbi:TetR/AcrR family transcriptional regulator [Cocleimonas flava]|jgi:AcrR family transcriptional regulator|uniref:TetR family transcriptional regulator n=1 Tax=Cocleimonas flava TaxID=634765 RepID=A0A4R1EZX5_9GAMM|nr:TetR/AcrR family transcriptional regulator [Cocleimonas flava]TCJ84788.1 TetR family transcriptional regulator [Cocleimonas flava]
MSAGRKRTFDKDEALDKAMRVFWKNGYSGTSLSDLTTELGINKPSLYAAFGNKEKLFEAALERYLSEYASPLSQTLSEGEAIPVKDALRAYIYKIIEIQAGDENPGGCFFVKSHCESGGVGFPDDMSALMEKKQAMHEEMISNFLQQKIAEGQFTEEANLKEITGYLMAVIYGLSVHARTGKSKQELQEIANFSLNMLPVK